MLYTDILCGRDSVIFITDKDGKQKVYYKGKNHFVDGYNDSYFITEIINFTELYGIILQACVCGNNFYFKTDQAVYSCGPDNKFGQLGLGHRKKTHVLTEISNFYELYGDIIFMKCGREFIYFFTDKNGEQNLYFCGLKNHGSLGGYRKKDNIKSPTLFPFVDNYGIPEIITETPVNIYFKTDQGIFSTYDHKKFETIIDKQQLMFFEKQHERIKEIISVSKFGSPSNFALLQTNTGLFRITDCVKIYDGQCIYVDGCIHRLLSTGSILYKIKASKIFTENNILNIATKYDNFLEEYGEIIKLYLGRGNDLFILTVNGLYKMSLFYKESMKEIVTYNGNSFFQEYGLLYQNKTTKCVKSTNSIE